MYMKSYDDERYANDDERNANDNERNANDDERAGENWREWKFISGENDGRGGEYQLSSQSNRYSPLSSAVDLDC